MIKIAYFWTWEFSRNILKNLILDKQVKIELIISQPDKKVWRKQEIEETPVKLLAKENNIEILQPIKLKENKELENILKEKNLDFIIVVAYWKIIPKEILNIPKYYPINIHWSILPKYRWASPVQECLKNWDKETWLTIMKMSEWMDEWDIFTTKKIEINIKDKNIDVFKNFEKFWASLLTETLNYIIDNKITAKPQDNIKATYCTKIEKSDWKIKFQEESSEIIYNKFRAYYNWPWIYTYYKGKKLSIEDCFFSKEDILWEKGSILKTQDWDFWIKCNWWILILFKIKLEWKKELDIKDFINWNKDFLNYKFD